MTQEQLDIIGWYYQRTPAGEIPAWVFGLFPMTRGEEWDGATYLPWDYGIEQDQELVCFHRHGALPFYVMPDL